MSIAAELRRLLRAHRYGALSTLSEKLAGFPFGSITPYLADQDGSLLSSNDKTLSVDGFCNVTALQHP